MNDDSDTRNTSSTAATMMGFTLGAVVGAGLALLLAPESGRKTRQRLASTARRWNSNAGDTLDRARDSVAELGNDAKAAIKAGRDAFQHDRPTRESRSEHQMSHAGDPAPGANTVKRSSEEAAR